MSMTHHNVTLLTHTDISLSCPVLPQSHSYLAQVVTRTPRHHHIYPSLNHFTGKNPRVRSLQSPVSNLQLLAVGLLPVHLPSQTLQLTRSTQSSSCLTLTRPPVTSSHLMFSNRAITITAPSLWNCLEPELRTFSIPPPSSLPIKNHHLHP